MSRCGWTSMCLSGWLSLTVGQEVLVQYASAPLPEGVTLGAGAFIGLSAVW